VDFKVRSDSDSCDIIYLRNIRVWIRSQ